MNNTFKQKTTLHIGYDGEDVTSVLKVQLQLDNDGRGAIVMIERDGESLQNKHGGYSCMHTGSHAYLTKMFNRLEECV